MAVLTIYRLAEECLRLLSGGELQLAGNVTIPELKIAIGQVANSLLKTEHFQVNEKMGEKIPNGSVLGLYDGINPVSWVTGRSTATLSVKPIKLPRNMGIWSVYFTDDPANEFIPLQMGQSNLIKSQPMINGMLGQICYEPLGGMDIAFTKDLPALFPGKTLSMRLAIMDINEYGDYDPLPLLPEHEWQIKKEVIGLYAGEQVADKLVDSATKQQQGIPLKQQQQSP
jgi:hypothetical protein